ncbi:SusC/RagA family TonB-linked outer membrane protein [Pedobacter ginsengisoli]|uniref:SusC/RagA family TonB-linked outer membrane protein n=1 Tax=Pedobacter ginsengisoli TaxID=363852 RepID=A0A2D1U727_9SPHI|nr:TonB-dependent receptor [Pedobacter ginsengisoli]ATP57403.1 SusC/RagA family TonB-linked outer membrane protein [Pedobacter ginsengisoli]
MKLKSKAKLPLWLQFPKPLLALPLTALSILAVCRQANAKYTIKASMNTELEIRRPALDNPINIINIKGKVTDEKGLPLPGVSVRIKGTTGGTQTDTNGNYTISVPNDQATLVFSYVGYNIHEQQVGNSTSINVVLTSKNSDLSEVVVVGYGTQKKGDVVGAVSTVKGEAVLQNASPSVSNSLAGRVPGLIVSNRSGEPGADGANLLIRGLNSFGGGTSPLVVVDGIPDRDLNRLNPDDIENVTILKDASAAIYGVRSANGVILITTKRGKTGKAAIHYDGSYSIQQLTKFTHRVNAWEYMTYFNELNLNQGNTAPYAQSEIDKYKAGNDPNYTSTDWMDAVFRKNAPLNNHSLSVQGGGEQVKYYFSAQTLDQQSNLRNSDQRFKQFNIRSNIDANISPNLKVNLDIAARKENKNNPVVSLGQTLHEAVSMYPFLPVYWPNGSANAGVSNGRNPAIMTSSLPGYDRTNYYTVNPTLGFDLKLPYLVKGLSLNGYAAFDYKYVERKTFRQPWDAYTYDATSNTYSNQRSSTSILSLAQDAQLTNQNTYFLKLAYDQKFGDHSINAFAGVEQTTSNWNDTYAYRRDLLSNQLDQLFTGSTVDQNATGSASQDGRESYLGRASYAFKNKYLAEASFRHNGSFNFPTDKRWGLFPAISLGWKISEEAFFKDNIKGVDQLKFRASWGLMGNDAVAQYLYVTRYQLVNNPIYYTYFGENYTEVKNLYLSATPNPNITWEKQDTRNIGFDAAFLSNRLNVTFDAFRFLRRDILAQRNASVPQYTGLSLPPENIGKSLNRGIDFSINYNETKNNFRYNFGANFTYTKSKIIFRDESPNIPEWQKSTGYAIDSWLVYQTKGIYHTQTEVDNSPHMSGAKPGDLWLIDKSGDGNITSDDMVRVPESATPKIMYGLVMGAEYKGVALNMVWSGQAMAKQMILPQSQGSLVAPPQYLYDGRWTPENPNAEYPRAFNSTDPRNSISADFWLRNAAFLRLKTVEISYSLPTHTFEKYGIGAVKVFAGATNMFTFGSMKKYGVDPETNNITGINYPQTRIFRFGLNVNL